MGRGRSKLGGGAAGVEIKDIGNAALKSTLQNITGDILMGKSYTYARSQKDGKIIDKNTNVGDVFSHGSVSYKKNGANQWSQVGDADNVFGSDGMARILAGLTSLPGTWTYKKK